MATVPSSEGGQKDQEEESSLSSTELLRHTPSPTMDAPSYNTNEDIADYEASLQEAAMAVPDSDAISTSSLQTISSDTIADQQGSIVQGSENDTSHQLDWAHMLGLSGQSLNAATTATSFGFAAARTTTSFGINLAKRITQGLVALPAMAIDGAVLGNTPGASGSSTPTISQVAHAAVGGVFDVISTLALGGIDVGSAITGASLGAAASGVEGVRRALGSEVLRSLGAFSRLVKREWYSASDTLPPGGIPGYSVLGITQALTAWVCIQMVTREYYEKKMLRHLEPVNLIELHQSIQREKEEEAKREQQASQGNKEAQGEVEKKDAHREDTPGATSTTVNRKQKKQVRILEERTLPDGEGDLIGAEIGRKEEPVKPQLPMQHAIVPTETTPAKPELPAEPQPLTNQEAILGLKRYSKLVLGVYGGVALAWLGSLPPDLMQAAGSVVDGGAPTVTQSRQEPLLGHTGKRRPALDDEADFLKAAASLDLDEDELVDDEMDGEGVLVEASGTPSPSGMPGGFQYGVQGKAKPVKVAGASKSVATQPAGEVLFSADPEAMTARQDSRVTSAAIPAPTTASTTTATAESTPVRQGSSYSYLDLLSGQADADIFHRLGGLEDGAATEGSYEESANQARNLERMQPRVARPSKPRYYVVTDHGNKKIILVLRGSLSLGDIAIDLTCESANFDFGNDGVDANDGFVPIYPEDEGPEPAQDFSPEAIAEREAKLIAEAQEKQNKPQARPHERGDYIVHEGMYETAKEIGEPGRPVHRAVHKALLKNPGYNLDITGHSLGAGVTALLAIMWASPDTCLTTARSGLPPGRRTHAFCFAVPCVMGNKLAKKTEKLVTSYCHSYDLICRLSLGAILDIRNACAWLAYENSLESNSSSSSRAESAAATTSNAEAANPTPPPPPSTSQLAHPLRLTNVMQRAFRHQSGAMNSNLEAKTELESSFLGLRKTLEANMRHVELYPPGVVLYSLAKEDLTPSLVIGAESSLTTKNHYLYRLNDEANRDEVFGQIIFSRGMMSRHMPHIYHDALDAM